MVGCATLHLGLRHPSRALSLCVAGCGYGAELNMREQFRAEADAVVASLQADGMAAFASRYAHGPTRVQFEAKNPRGFAIFKQALAGHSALGAINTQLGCQKERPSLYHLQNEMAGLTVTKLILTGDEDWPCLAPALLMKRTIPSAALSVMPNCGHTINLEAPDLFNGIVGDFIAQVDAGRWPTRDPRASWRGILAADHGHEPFNDGLSYDRASRLAQDTRLRKRFDHPCPNQWHMLSSSVIEEYDRAKSARRCRHHVGRSSQAPDPPVDA